MSELVNYGLGKYFSEVNEYRNYTRRSRLIMVLADQYSLSNFSPKIEDLHILRALGSIDQSVGLAALKEVGADCFNLLPEIIKITKQHTERVSLDRSLGITGSLVIKSATDVSLRMGNKYIASEHIAIGLMADNTESQSFLSKYGVTTEALTEKVFEILKKK